LFEKLGDWIESRTGYRGVVKHALDEPIPGGARWRYVFGSALTATFLIQLLTGLLLMMTYSPSSTTAWGSVYFITYRMNMGWLLRGIHHFGSQAMVILLVLHLAQVVLAGAYRAPREMNWWLGIGLMFVTLGFSLTGYLLPWDQKGYWATKVATNIMGGTPLIGPYLRSVLVGGAEYGNQTLTRFFALHVGFFPLALFALLGAHVALFRKHGVTHPVETRGRMGRFWPHQVFLDVVVSVIVVGILCGFSVQEYLQHGGPNLDAPADPASSDYPARPEWYFLSLFQMLKLFPGEQEMIGTIVVPGAIVAVLLLLPLLDKLLPRRLGHFLACAFVFALLGGAGYLTYQATVADLTNAKFQDDRGRAEEAARRARFLADNVGIAPEGAGYLLARDPLYHGRRVLEQKCLSCHHYEGHGQITNLVFDVKPEDLEGLETRSPQSPGIPEGARLAAERKVEGFAIRSATPIEVAGRVAEYAFVGSNAKGELVEARVDRDVKAVEVSIESKQTASDLFGYGGRGWLRGLLSEPEADTYFGKVTQCNGMAGWRRNTKLTERELNDIANWFERFVITTPEDLPAAEWEAREEVYSHPGYEAFNKEGECASCHVMMDTWAAPNDGAPNLFGWGSPWYIGRMIRRPGAPHNYGYLEPSEQMPGFGERLSDDDIATVVRFLKGDYRGAPNFSPGQGGHQGPVQP
jgi:ubiquinol-cytochrome c reductase cytochrome b subunit